MTPANLPMKQKQTHRQQTGGSQGGVGGIDQEFGVSSCKLLYIEWTDTQAYWVARASLVAHRKVKSLPATQDTQVQSLGGKDPLEEEMATQPSILLWEIPWTEEPGGLQSMGSQRVRWDRVTQHIHPV